MANYISHMPFWVIILFVASFLFSIVFITKPVKRAALNAGITPQKSHKIQVGIIIFYLVYLAYVSLLSLKGIFQGNSIPPKVMVLAGLPLAIILFGFIGNTRLFNHILRTITLESLITIHVFRIVGVFFIMLYCYNLLQPAFALSAGLGDIITALLAFPVAKLVSTGARWRISAVIAWNIFGMLDIIRLLFLATIIAKNTATTGVDGGLREITLFPFVWFPAFAPATILFLHTLIFRKLNQQKQIATIDAPTRL